MLFVITETPASRAAPKHWTWALHQVSRREPVDPAICVSAQRFTSEADARSNIATARRAFRGTKYARVIIKRQEGIV